MLVTGNNPMAKNPISKTQQNKKSYLSLSTDYTYCISDYCILGYCLRGKISGYCISGLWHIGYLQVGFLFMMAQVFDRRAFDIGF
jgi:hypothetical protein